MLPMSFCRSWYKKKNMKTRIVPILLLDRLPVILVIYSARVVSVGILGVTVSHRKSCVSTCIGQESHRCFYTHPRHFRINISTQRSWRKRKSYLHPEPCVHPRPDRLNPPSVRSALEKSSDVDCHVGCGSS